MLCSVYREVRRSHPEDRDPLSHLERLRLRLARDVRAAPAAVAAAVPAWQPMHAAVEDPVLRRSPAWVRSVVVVSQQLPSEFYPATWTISAPGTAPDEPILGAYFSALPPDLEAAGADAAQEGEPVPADTLLTRTPVLAAAVPYRSQQAGPGRPGPPAHTGSDEASPGGAAARVLLQLYTSPAAGLPKPLTTVGVFGVLEPAPTADHPDATDHLDAPEQGRQLQVVGQHPHGATIFAAGPPDLRPEPAGDPGLDGVPTLHVLWWQPLQLAVPRDAVQADPAATADPDGPGAALALAALGLVPPPRPGSVWTTLAHQPAPERFSSPPDVYVARLGTYLAAAALPGPRNQLPATYLAAAMAVIGGRALAPGQPDWPTAPLHLNLVLPVATPQACAAAVVVRLVAAARALLPHVRQIGLLPPPGQASARAPNGFHPPYTDPATDLVCDQGFLHTLGTLHVLDETLLAEGPVPPRAVLAVRALQQWLTTQSVPYQFQAHAGDMPVRSCLVSVSRGPSILSGHRLQVPVCPALGPPGAISDPDPDLRAWLGLVRQHSLRAATPAGTDPGLALRIAPEVRAAIQDDWVRIRAEQGTHPDGSAVLPRDALFQWLLLAKALAALHAEPELSRARWTQSVQLDLQRRRQLLILAADTHA